MRGRAGAVTAPGATLAVIFALASSLLSPTASAHSGLVKSRWARGTTIQYDYTASINRMPSGSRGRIDKGAAEWTKIGGTVRFRPGRNVPDYSPSSCPNPPKNAVHYRKIDGPGNTIGLGQRCFTSTGQITSMNVTFDTAENWFAGSGPPPAGRIDVWAVATHEFGHTLGMDHFQLSDAVCKSAPVETMCPIYSPPMRDPDPHDIHIFTPVYGGG